MPRADVNIFYSTNKPAFARPDGAVADAETSGVAAGASGALSVEAPITGVSTSAESGSMFVPQDNFFESIATPEQIAIKLDASIYPQGVQATCRYKKTADSLWTTGHDLFRVQPGEANTPAIGTVEDVFAWVIIGLDTDTSYDIEVTADNNDIYSSTVSTRALPATASTNNKTITAGSSSAQIQTALDNLVAGDVIEFEDGSYTLSGITLSVTGTEGSPIYIRGQSRAGVTLTDTTGDIFAMQTVSNVIIENLTIVGSGVDSGTSASSVAFVQSDLYAATNFTVRNIICTGVDRFVDLYKDATGVLVYDNTITGNNLWQTTPTNFLGSNITWDDAGIKLPGNGNCAFNNTITGFGDTFSYASHSGSDVTGEGNNIHFYRNDVWNSCDDPVEVDHAIRNCTWYDNRITNSINCDSIDPLYGGPWISARNICINPYRVNTHKWNSQNSGMFLYNNTVVATSSLGTDADVSNWYQPNQGAQDHWGYQNNVHIYAGSGQSIWFESAGGHADIDFSNNAWYPDRAIDWPDITAANLASVSAPVTTPIFSGKQRHADDVIVTSQPFDTAVVLGANALTEVTTEYTPTISSGENAKNAGVVIANITDGYSGANPDMGAIIAGRSVVAYGDRTDALPSWYPAVGTIVELSDGTTIRNTAEADGAGSYPGTDDADLCSPWSGGCLVYVGGQPYLTAEGGGHNDGAYNGILKFGPLTGVGSDSPTWSLFNPASGVGNVISASVAYSDGKQSSTHTYNNLVGVGDTVYETRTDYYDPAGGGSGIGFAITPSSHTQIAATPAGLFGATSYYDGKLYAIGANGQFDRLRIYDIAGDSWSSESNADIFFNNYPAAAADTTRGGLLITNGSQTVYWNLNTLTRYTGRNNPGGYDQSLEYDSDRDVFVSHASGSQTVYEVDAASLFAGSNPSWSSRGFSGATPAAAPAAGTYGRFRYVPELKGYILVPNATSSVYFYRSS